MMYRTVTVNAVLSDSIIEVTPSIVSNVIETNAEVLNKVKTYSADEYEGSYSVTPTEEAQTLLTENKILSENMNVGAISSSYVGSAIPRRQTSDISVSGAFVDVPNGYYDASHSKSVEVANSLPAPSVSLNSGTGLVTATETISRADGAWYENLSANKSYQLPTQEFRFVHAWAGESCGNASVVVDGKRSHFSRHSVRA